MAEFARRLKDGRLVGSRCEDCGRVGFPPRADCPDCRSGRFTFTEYGGGGTVVTFTRIAAAPAGFEGRVPFTIGVVDLDEGGRLLAWCGDTLDEATIAIGQRVQVVPRLFGESEAIKVHYTLEAPGTTWAKA
ncbi:Zn-ribbon domain-containing OB-fold protein [bacterium]|nr:Zn-ribbon domain-containing OB-fold protein [bacterium]